MPVGLEAVRRGSALFLLNHGAEAAQVTLPASMHDLLTNSEVGRAVAVEPGAAMVLIEGLTQ
jgi:beta-galactosidase